MKFIEANKDFCCYIPHILTSLRIVFTFSFIFVYFIDIISLALFLFIFAVVTDILDGIIARKLGVCSTFGSFFDVTADFFLIISAFIVFVIEGIYPFWITFLIGFMFLQFLLSSRYKKLIYDPIGKYLFLFLIIIVFITFISTEPLVCDINCVAFSLFCVVSLIFRYTSLHKSLRN